MGRQEEYAKKEKGCLRYGFNNPSVVGLESDLQRIGCKINFGCTYKTLAAVILKFSSNKTNNWGSLIWEITM